MQLQHTFVLLLITLLSFDPTTGASLPEISNSELETQLWVRSKRDADDGNIFQFINDLVGSSINDILSGLVLPIQELIDTAFDSVIASVLELQYNPTPGNDIEALIANVVNLAIEQAVAILKLVQTRIHDILNTFVLPPA